MPIPPFRPDGWLPPGHHDATWEEVGGIFGGAAGSRRKIVWERLQWLRKGLTLYGVKGSLILDGSFVSAKDEPRDFDVLLVAEPGIEAVKGGSPDLAMMLDPVESEREGYSILYAQTNSLGLDELLTIWNRTKDGRTEKGVVRLEL